ncbi:interleukin-1 receptor-associated kinase 4-like [Haliotis cracherodii]|uniref:interleukin-1 receptor-associated kinase 4-like n=1 Tax=Haliotis cracherodii TaxID=6455 RepID=UPI0039EB4186
MGGQKVTGETYTRHLPYSVVAKLTSLLEPGKQWEKFVVNIPRKLVMLDQDDFVPKYDLTYVSMIEDRGKKPGASSTRAILDDWGTQNVRVKHLIKVLVISELYGAADYLSVNVLDGDPVPRPRLETSDRTGQENLSEQATITPKEYEDRDTIYIRKLEGGHALSETQETFESMGEERRLSVRSGLPSVDLKSEPRLESLRAPGESDEIAEEEEILRQLHGNEAILLRQLDYKMLKHITNNFNEIELSKGGNMIGRGGFGTVFLGQFNNGFKIAVKCLKEENDDNLKQFQTELNVLSKYRHENIVHLLGYSKEDANHCLIYQYMPNGSLEDRLGCKNETEPLDCQVRLSIAQGTARGINYLNENGFVHRDIKSANVLLDKDFTPKVGDFATARLAPKGTGATCTQTMVVIGTSAYLAPEAYQFDVSAKLDTYSYGVVLLELLTGLPSFDEEREDRDLWTHMEENCEDIMDMVDQSAGSWKEETAIAMYTIATRCLVKKKHRPLMEDILPELESLSNQKLCDRE